MTKHEMIRATGDVDNVISDVASSRPDLIARCGDVDWEKVLTYLRENDGTLSDEDQALYEFSADAIEAAL